MLVSMAMSGLHSFSMSAIRFRGNLSEAVRKRSQ